MATMKTKPWIRYHMYWYYHICKCTIHMYVCPCTYIFNVYIYIYYIHVILLMIINSIIIQISDYKMLLLQVYRLSTLMYSHLTSCNLVPGWGFFLPTTGGSWACGCSFRVQLGLEDSAQIPRKPWLTRRLQSLGKLEMASVELERFIFCMFKLQQ